MPRNKKRTTVIKKNQKGTISPLPQKKLPWYATTSESKSNSPAPMVPIDNKTLVEWNAAQWIKKLISACEKIGTTIHDPKVMTHTPLGSLVMEWEIGTRFLQVLVFTTDTFATISYIGEDGELLAETEDGWSQGPINTEEEIERAWRWLIGRPVPDTSFLSELFSITKGERSNAGVSR